MNQYIFILGNNPELSVAEIKSVYPQISVIKKTDLFLIGQIDNFDCQKALNNLGGTIKIGQVIGDKLDEELIIKEIIKKAAIKIHPVKYREAVISPKAKLFNRVNYGLSFYKTKPSSVGLEIKRKLKELGISSRLVVSKEPILSSVIVKKNKVMEFLVLPDALGLTGAVQEFEEYGKRDYNRPKIDAHSGLLPPKLAKMMINLSLADKNGLLLDPFCGSGTVLSEALALGYKNLIGSDVSPKASSDTTDNLDWLSSEYQLTDAHYQIYNLEVSRLSDKLKPASIDAIVSEPYLGPTLKGDAKENKIFKIITEVAGIYLKAFQEFKTVLKPDGRVVIVLPLWRLNGREFNLKIENKIADLGFRRQDKNNLIYKRPEQKIWRQIEIWQSQ